jgi:large subunit ribosomal protein L35
MDRRYRLRQHVFCNAKQSKLLDKMVTDFWKKPKHWVDNPYEPYHKRENFEKLFPQKSRPFFP